MKERFYYGGAVLTFEIFLRKAEGEDRLPLLVWLPGEEGLEEENEKALSFFKKECGRKNFHFIALEWDEFHPFREPEVCKAIQLLIFQTRKKWRMDVCRTYLAGFSEGAAGVWQLLAGYPRMFAAGIAIAGYGDPWRIRSAREIPIWAFHAADDEQIPSFGPVGRKEGNLMVGSAQLVQGLRNVGAGENLRFTQPVSGGHRIVEKALNEELTEWLCRQNRKKVFRTERICSGVYKIDDYFMSSCYLIEGRKRALLIDTGMGEGNFRKLLGELTDRPVSLAVTHPHPDHIFHSCLFEEIYIHREAARNFSDIYDGFRDMDLSAFDSLWNAVMPPRGEGKVKALTDGAVIELDDVCRIKTAFLPGHTEYDCVFIDDSHRLVFTGDAVGSGYTVGIPMSADDMEEVLSAYENSLGSFLNRYGEAIRDYGFLGGHFIQENGCDDTVQEDWLNGQSRFFSPLSLRVVEDMKALCGRILAGKCRNEKEGAEYSWSYKSARISGVWRR